MSVSQTQFRAALLDPDHPVPSGLSDGDAQAAGARFNVYRNNIAVSLTEAMYATFPLITKLLGHENMDGLAGLFLRQHPPSNPLMMFYGVEFPDFMAGMEQLAHLGYLPDVARLELAMHQSYHARDTDPITPELLAQTTPEDLMNSTVTLAPSLQILRSDWPVHDIWRFNMEIDAAKPEPGPQDVLVTRVEFDPEPKLLPSGGADWITALAKGQSIGDAHETVMVDHPDFDLGATLGLLLQGGAVTSLCVKE